MLKIVILLAPMVMLGAFAMDIYVPAVPFMAQNLHTTPEIIQLTLSLFMIFFGLGQLIIGPITDRFGRKPVALFCMMLFIISSAGCMLSSSANMLILWRCIEGFSACGCLVVGFAIVRDAFADHQRSQLYSYLTASIGVAPILGPILGSVLIETTQTWRATFAFLLPFSVLSIIAFWVFFEETLKKENQVRLHIVKTFILYKNIFFHKDFFRYTLCMTTHMAGLFCFFSASPIILIQVLGVSTFVYSAFFACNAVIYTLANIVSTKISAQKQHINMVQLGLIFMSIGAAAMLLGYGIFGVHIAVFLLPQAVIATGIGLIPGPGTAGATQAFGHVAGTATALMGALEFSLAGLLGSIMMQFDPTTPQPMAITLLILCAITLLVFVALAPAKRV